MEEKSEKKNHGGGIMEQDFWEFQFVALITNVTLDMCLCFKTSSVDYDLGVSSV
jgi:hypothetical protein